MTFIRTGTCNQCGECCGYPRLTDSGQNNAWANDFPESIANWSKEDIENYLPIFKIVGHPNHGGKLYGMSLINDVRCFWIWVPGHGLCKDKTPHGDLTTYDIRCPFLSEKLSDGTVPCLLYNTHRKFVWDKLCQPVPPNKFDTQEQVDNWFINCPSCSYEYVVE